MKYIRPKDDSGVNIMREKMRREVKAAELGGVGLLVYLFDWVDGLDPQPTISAVSHMRNHRVAWPTSSPL